MTLFLGALLAVASVFAGACGVNDAPALYASETCASHCTNVAGQLLCDTNITNNADTEMWAVTDYAGDGGDDISV